jgi:deoxyribonuclease-1
LGILLSALLGLQQAYAGSENLLLGNRTILHFTDAKKVLFKLHQERALTLYCRCKYSEKTPDLKSCGYQVKRNPDRARRIEWEHVVPAENFGRSFIEWREGASFCVDKKGKRYKGRKCAAKNPLFAKMEADLYNLFPEIGELNELRGNKSMAEVGALGKFAGVSFGDCKARIWQSKFEPMNFAKGTVARAYLYMDLAYPERGILSDKNNKLYEAWDKLYPVEPWECELYQKIKVAQKSDNPILEARCAKK